MKFACSKNYAHICFSLTRAINNLRKRVSINFQHLQLIFIYINVVYKKLQQISFYLT